MIELTNQRRNRRYSIGLSIAGSFLIILFFSFINFSTSPNFPWFMFPAYAVLWWPIATIFRGRHSAKLFSLVGSLITIVLLFVTNYLTSWSYPWFLFPSFAILWWPIGVFFGSRNYKVFSLISSAVIVVFFVITNLVTSPSVIWFHYPVFAVIWWPLSVYLADTKRIKIYSALGSLIIMAFLTLDNIMKSPVCPWALFAYFPVLMWPVAMLLGRRMGRLNVSLIGCLMGIVYYTALNIYVFKGFPWAIYPAYALLWWPLAIAFAKKGKPLAFSISGSLLSAAMFIATNWLTTPNQIWAVYPIFAIAWWPLAVYYFNYKRRLI